jgi:hypothetical protein
MDDDKEPKELNKILESLRERGAISGSVESFVEKDLDEVKVPKGLNEDGKKIITINFKHEDIIYNVIADHIRRNNILANMPLLSDRLDFLRNQLSKELGEDESLPEKGLRKLAEACKTFIFATGEGLSWLYPKTLQGKDSKEFECFTSKPFYEHDALAGYLSDFFIYRKAKKENYDWTPLPDAISKPFLKRAGVGLTNIQQLNIFSRCPILLESGEVINQKGYNEKHKAFFDPAGEVFPDIPENPTREDALNAMKAFKKLLEHFEFEDDYSLSVILAEFLTVVTKNLYPTIPCFVHNSSESGAGKTLLSNTASILATGEDPLLVNLGNEDRLREEIVAAFEGGLRMIVIDDIAKGTPLGGSFIQTLLTAQSYSARPKYGRTAIKYTDYVIFANGNEIQFKGDMARRCLIANICGKERADEQNFPFNPAEIIRKKRGLFVSKAITIVKAYILWTKIPASEMPLNELEIYNKLKALSRAVGGFEKWDLIRKCLIWLGEPDPRDSRCDIESRDPRREELSVLLKAMQGAFGDNPLTCAEMLEAARVSSTPEFTTFLEALNAYMNGRNKPCNFEDPKKASFYMGLSFARDSQWTDGLRLVAIKKRDRQAYIIETASEKI